MLDTQHLSILREFHRHGSVTAAADKLNVTQSALSHTIARLEDRCGVKLWTKKGRGLKLTHAGEYLLGVANRILPQIEHAENVLNDFADGRRGAIKIGMECHPCSEWLSRVSMPYLTQWPDIDVEVCTASLFDGVGALADYQIDVLVTPDPVNQPDLLFTPVLDYELLLIVHETHSLADRTVVQPADLLDEELITVPVSLDRLDIYTKFLVPAQCRPRRHRTVETVDLMLQLVSARRGVTVLPDWLIHDKLDALSVRALRLGSKGIKKSINLGVRVGDEQVSYIQGFLALARDIGRRGNTRRPPMNPQPTTEAMG